MSNNTSKYREDILRLSTEGKKYKEISLLLNCSVSVVQYHLSTKQQVTSSLSKKKRINEDKISRKKGVARNRKYVDNYLLNKSCIDCGNSDKRVLEFDHVRGIKVGPISQAIRNAWNIEKLKTEISKCEVRCCNCHRIVTIQRRTNVN